MDSEKQTKTTCPGSPWAVWKARTSLTAMAQASSAQEPVRAAADGREGHAVQAVLAGQPQARAVAGGQQLFLALATPRQTGPTYDFMVLDVFRIIFTWFLGKCTQKWLDRKGIR